MGSIQAIEREHMASHWYGCVALVGIMPGRDMVCQSGKGGIAHVTTHSRSCPGTVVGVAC